MSVKSQVRLTLSFRRPSPTFADFRGNVCGHCADIDISEPLREAPWRGSRPGSPTTATPGSSPATATPKADNAPPAPTPPAGPPNAPPNREEAKVRDGAWHDHSRGQVTFAELRRDRLAALQAGRDLHPRRLPVLPRQALHPHLRTQADGQDPALRDPTLGHHRHRERPLRRVGAEVPHHAALGLRTRPARPGRHLQPLRPHRAPQSDQEARPGP